MRQHKLAVDYIRSILNYDPDTGAFTWRERPDHPRKWNSRYAGALAGYVSNGYLLIRIDKLGYYGGQLAWAYAYGEWPALQVDHINRDRADNRLTNLRLATNAQNSANRGPQRNNLSSGVRGVSFHASSGKWRARIKIHGTEHDLGLFPSIELAREARNQRAAEILGEFAGDDTATTIYAPRNTVDRSRNHHPLRRLLRV